MIFSNGTQEQMKKMKDIKRILFYIKYQYLLFKQQMRTLAKPNNNKLIKNKQTNKPNIQQPANNHKNNKQQSKKVMKTIFQNPFHYKIQILCIEECQNVSNTLIQYSKTLRKQFGSQIKSMSNQKVIKFDSKVNYQKPALVVKDFVYGIKQCLSILKKNLPLQMIIYFYEQSKHDVFEQLMCNTLYRKIPYILTRQNPLLRKQLGLKNLLALGINNEEIANSLLIYCSKCMIEIPWLVNVQWIPLK